MLARSLRSVFFGLLCVPCLGLTLLLSGCGDSGSATGTKGQASPDLRANLEASANASADAAKAAKAEAKK